MAEPNNSSERYIIYALVLIVVLFLLRFAAAFRFVLFGLVVIGALGGLGYWWWQRRQRMRYVATTEGRIAGMLDYAREQLALNSDEINRIKAHLEELNAEQPPVGQENSNVWTKSIKLKEGFQAEMELRRSKAAFFRAGIEKLEALQHRNSLAKRLEGKQDELRRLQSDHYEEIADLEAFGTEVEYNAVYLDEIDRLSRNVLDTDSPEITNRLRYDLEDMVGRFQQNKEE